ncbi:hypothetical protein B4102_3282 [Heyndrickxia sporothermodurans]|uniref:Uncharacterized protein n=1 Tax=Heyndrickxia sporothermodurans TaxID=46224 RepID=A0A150KXJ7_9BACI|nr:hypothetical protein B4102_3282 [Heyndrickxia sporothermodurans]
MIREMETYEMTKWQDIEVKQVGITVDWQVLNNRFDNK